jgi:hypothetical protein
MPALAWVDTPQGISDRTSSCQLRNRAGKHAANSELPASLRDWPPPVFAACSIAGFATAAVAAADMAAREPTGIERMPRSRTW